MKGASSSTPRRAVVTGTASGIGHAVAEHLLADGWRVIGVDRASQRTATEMFTPIQCDLLDAPALEGIAQRLAHEVPAVTALVHAAGLMRSDAHPDIRPTGGDVLWRLHVVVAEMLIHHLAPAMPDGAGRIVLLSSRAAQGRPHRSFYAASKAGVEALARCYAATFVTRGLTVNAVAPGATDTPQLRDPERADAVVRTPPIGRLIEPSEVAALIAFLIGPQAGAITGQTITICGGASLSASMI